MKHEDSLRRLSQRHHAGLLFCWKVRQGLKREGVILRIRKYVLYFRENYFEPIFREQALHLLPKTEESIRREVRGQHQDIERLICRVAPAKAPAPALLGQLANAVHAHIRYEKGVLFPHLALQLGESELERVAQSMESERGALFRDAFPDMFWIKSDVPCACKM